MESSSFSGSSKRAKAPGNITQVSQCLVDGCNADLSLCRDYHRRHKVCETHSKTPKVTIGGREQRFCQQCSSSTGEDGPKILKILGSTSTYKVFHSLVEFDEGKRSCRKRLEGHNRRRRKPQPDSLARNPALIFPTQQGTTLLSFTTPQIMQTSVVGPSWAPQVIKPENEPMLFNNHHLNYIDRANSFPRTSAHNHQLHFIQQEPAMCRPVIDPNADGLNEVVESDRALSLLSSAPLTREPQAHQSLAHSFQYSGLSEYAPGSCAPATHGSDDSNVHFSDMFQQGNEGSSTSGSHQTLSFMWE